jgi:hypothetical protein
MVKDEKSASSIYREIGWGPQHGRVPWPQPTNLTSTNPPSTLHHSDPCHAQHERSSDPVHMLLAHLPAAPP